MGPWLGDDGGIAEEWLAEEAGVPVAALRIEDPELHPAPRRSGPVPGDDHLRPLADDVPAEPDPRPPGELQAEPGRLGDRARDGTREAGRLEDDEEDPGPTGERDQASEPLRDRRRAAAVPPGSARRLPARAPPLGREVHDEEVHRPARDKRAGHRQGLVEGGRLEDDEPFEANPAGDRLDRVQAPGEVHIGDDRAGRLGLRREPEGEGRLPARGVPPDGERGRARDAARSEDRVQRGEPGPDDPIVVRWQARPFRDPGRERDGRERSDDRSVPH